MGRKLKVFGTQTFLMHGVQNRTVAAATSMKGFAALIGSSLNYVRHYGCETGNAEEVKIAMSDIGSIFAQCKCCQSWVKVPAARKG
jgi:hypothetical protein